MYMYLGAFVAKYLGKLNHINVITFDWIKDNISKDYLRVNLKKQFFFY